MDIVNDYYFNEFDMSAMCDFGRSKAHHFQNCDPADCIEQLNEALNTSELSVYDYNFLLGIRYELEKVLET